MKLLIVDDSAVMRNILKDVFSRMPEFKVIGEASNGEKAIELNRELEPDIILMDISMPIKNGIEATRFIMKEKPVSILIFSGELDAQSSFDAIQNGAVDVLKKPSFDELNDDAFLKIFKEKLLYVSNVQLSTGSAKKMGSAECHYSSSDFKICCIGASTGGPVAVRKILSQLPETFPVGIALVQHLEKGFEEGYADWLDKQSALKVRLAKNNDLITPGEVLVSPVDIHLKVDGNRLILEDSAPVLNQKPSVDVLFESAAQSYRDKVLAVLLTGMGRDGADGCVAVKQNQGFTVAQDEKSSTIFGMPKAAIEQNGVCEILPLDEIADFMVKVVGG